MLDWIRQNSALISAFANLGMLAVWMFYAQLLYNGFRRERRSRVLINKGIGSAGAGAPCVICNMSKEPIFIQGIIIELETTDGTYSTLATDSEEAAADPEKAKPGSRTRQGPLPSGSCIEVQSFRGLIHRAARAGGLDLIGDAPSDPEVKICSLTVTVVSIYGPEDNPFGATRTFQLSSDEAGVMSVKPESIDTTRLANRHGRKRAKELLSQTF